MNGFSEHRRDKKNSMHSYCRASQTYRGKRNMIWELAIEAVRVSWNKKKILIKHMRSDP